MDWDAIYFYKLAFPKEIKRQTMGITKECFKHYEKLVNNSILDFKRCKVTEIGSQTVHFDDKDFLRQWAINVNIDFSFVPYMYPDISGQEMHRFFGHDYQCVDLDDFNGKIKPLACDLNVSTCPNDWRQSSDLVTNYGTTEHLINQLNVFEFIHDLTRPWGAMVHVLPMVRFNHGFFNYNPVFFTSLAHANQYKIVGLYTSKDLQHNVLQEMVPYTGSFIGSHEYLHVILQKTNSNKFSLPNQVYLNGRYI